MDYNDILQDYKYLVWCDNSYNYGIEMDNQNYAYDVVERFRIHSKFNIDENGIALDLFIF